MDEIKNENIIEDEKVEAASENEAAEDTAAEVKEEAPAEEAKAEIADEVVASEEVMEVALAETVEEKAEGMEYTESELSGLTDKQKKRKEIFDKITTGILIALLASPVAIILYIFLWFIFR